MLLTTVNTKFIKSETVDYDLLIKQITEELLCGRVIAMATDTVFGLVASARSCSALQGIAQIKGRSSSISPPVLVANFEQLSSIALMEDERSPYLKVVLESLWPGPLTAVLPLKEGGVCGEFFQNNSIAVRLPSDERIRDIAQIVGPLAASSANIHGQETLKSGIAVYEQLKKKGNTEGLALVLDEESYSDKASTIIDFTANDYQIIREGALSAQAINRVFSVAMQK